MGLGFTRDVEEGLWMYEITYTHPFALNFRGKNPYVNGDADQFNEVHNRWDLHSAKEKERFAYYFKPYGENDLGGFFPPSVNLAVFRGFRGHKGFVHSLGLTFNVPLGVAWIPSFNAVEYNPVPDPQFRAWSGSVNYGLEFSRREIPFYFAVSKLIQDKTNTRDLNQDIYDEGVVSTWDGPDWNDFIQNWTFGVGLKAAMF
jgi:hypothetical protein